MNLTYLDIATSNQIPDLELYKDPSETPLRRLYEPEPGVFVAESALVIERAVDAGYKPMSVLVDEAVLENCMSLLSRPEYDGCPIYVLPKSQIGSIVGYNITRGILSLMRRKDNTSAADLLEHLGDKKSRIVVLEEVTNPTNVGAIFRSAAALYIDAVLLTSGCADPLYRRTLRVAMGNVFTMPWAYCDKDYIDLLHDKGYKCASLALNDKSISIEDPLLKNEKRLAMLMGSEGYGLDKTTIEASDYVVKIPMAEGVDSLNVAAASALAFWEVTRER